MWFRMQTAQHSYSLSERLIRAITQWNTLLHCDEDVEDLINQGADVNAVHGIVLPLQCACMVADVDMLNLLVQHGAQVDAIDGYGRAALHYAAEKDEECVSALISHGADVNVCDQSSDTALHWAAYKDKPLCVQALLQHGAVVNARDDNENTALNWACQRGNVRSIRILLDYNADPRLASYRGHTPIMRSAGLQASGLGNQDDWEALELLLRASGKFTLITSQEHTRDELGGNQSHDGLFPPIISQDNRMRTLLAPYVSGPRTLQDLCRYEIRQRLGRVYLPSQVPTLPLPNRLQQFLLLHS